MFFIKRIVIIMMLCVLLPLINGCASNLLNSKLAAGAGIKEFLRGDFNEALVKYKDAYNFSEKNNFNTAKAFTALYIAASYLSEIMRNAKTGLNVQYLLQRP